MRRWRGAAQVLKGDLRKCVCGNYDKGFYLSRSAYALVQRRARAGGAPYRHLPPRAGVGPRISSGKINFKLSLGVIAKPGLSRPNRDGADLILSPLHPVRLLRAMPLTTVINAVTKSGAKGLVISETRSVFSVLPRDERACERVRLV
ncbi:hypothetical protein EVAR_68328_1 [Eumeta japonica]|uniref:Uncharacterized protein n=1 Tax=Eumeta variegata TaxID=151549 RepID=A0A4C1SDV5_EUMVA|nr:hypothetical protein EVAR_68328_1 [Eumeta japonica]